MPIYNLHTVIIEGKGKEQKAKFQVPDYLNFVKKVGSGAYGSVASFKNANNGEMLAVKKITNAFDDLIDGKRILREVKLLRQLNHDNIIRILDMFPPESPDFNDIYIVTDLMESDLHRVIYSKQALTEEHDRFFVHQILRGLHYLHSANVVHRDLKPPNLLVNRNCDLKICDFGLARVLEDQDIESLQRTDYVVTRWYRAPEVVLVASTYTKSIDIWAVGCILCELIGRAPVFKGKDHLDQIKKIVSVLGTPKEDELSWLPEAGPARVFLRKCPEAPKASWGQVYPEASQEALSAVEWMLAFDPVARISVEGALRLPLFSALFEEADLKEDTRPSFIDWSFDNFEPTKRNLRNYIYCECASMHPEILERDAELLGSRAIDEILLKSQGMPPWGCAAAEQAGAPVEAHGVADAPPTEAPAAAATPEAGAHCAEASAAVAPTAEPQAAAAAVA